MKEWKMDYRTADIQNGVVHKVGELTTEMCSSIGTVRLSVIVKM
jgi:hypothetical protein